MKSGNILDKRVHLRRSTYYCSGDNSQYIEYEDIDIYVEDEREMPEVSGSVHEFTLKRIQKTSDVPDINSTIDQISNIPLNDMDTNSPLCTILEQTVQGQGLLEYVVSDNKNGPYRWIWIQQRNRDIYHI